MKHIAETIEHAIYGYDPKEFLPIYYDGRPSNLGKFALYKVGCIIRGRLI